MRRLLAFAIGVVVFPISASVAYSQHWSIGANMGMSSMDGSAGMHLAPVAELQFNRTLGFGTEFSINTQYGTPLLWYMYFRYYINFRSSGARLYGGVGPVVALNVPGPPCFGFLFTGGVSIPIANRVFLSPDISLGPVFDVGRGTRNLFMYGNYYGMGVYGASSYAVPGVTVFIFSVRAGIRYEI